MMKGFLRSLPAEVGQKALLRIVPSSVEAECDRLWKWSGEAWISFASGVVEMFFIGSSIGVVEMSSISISQFSYGKSSVK